MLKKYAKRNVRHARVRAKVQGTADTPRLAVYRSNANIYAQLIDDTASKTLCSASDIKIEKGTKTEKAAAVGTQIAELAKKAKITSCVFDRGGCKYQGRVQALADAARQGGLTF